MSDTYLTHRLDIFREGKDGRMTFVRHVGHFATWEQLREAQAPQLAWPYRYRSTWPVELRLPRPSTEEVDRG